MYCVFRLCQINYYHTIPYVNNDSLLWNDFEAVKWGYLHLICPLSKTVFFIAFFNKTYCNQVSVNLCFMAKR